MNTMHSNRTKAALCLVALTAALIGCGVLLWNVGGDRLALPGTSLDAWQQWLTTASPLTVALSLSRLLCLMTVTYLLASIAVSALAALTRSQGLAHFADAVSAAPFNTLARVAFGATAVLTLTTTTSASAQAVGTNNADAYSTPVLHHVDPTQQSLSTVAPSAQEQTQADEPAATVAPTVTTMLAPESTPQTTEGPVIIDLRDTPASTHTVDPGESLWVIARNTLTERNGTTTNADIANYVNKIVDANQVLTPNLIHPGQRLILPD